MNRKYYLRSKITIPQISHQLLPRKNVAAALDSAALNETVCFVAPYGYGKTLAVVSWLRDSGKNAVWITLDAADDSELVFFAGLSAAMKRFSGWQGDANDILSDPKYIGSPQGFLRETILAAEKNTSDKILVIDDFRYIRDPALLRSIKDFLTGLLGNWRVILMSRSELPSVFTEFILKGRMRLLTPKELSFSPEEMAEFFAINGCDASQEEVLQVRSETEGWPASLNVVLTISRGGPVTYGEAARAYVMGFFETEIWAGLGEDVKDFLLRTSILDQLAPPVCRAVADPGTTQHILRWLFVNGLFITRMDEKDT